MSAARRLLLLGAGHAHAQVLRDWARQPLPGAELLLVSPTRMAPYSGMVPGWLAGYRRFEDSCIDFAALAEAAGARFVAAEVVALDADARRVRLADGEACRYDLLSLNVGSMLRPPASPHAIVLPLRPLGALHAAWSQALEQLAAADGPGPLTVTAVGGGAAGIEALLAARTRLEALLPRREIHAALVTHSLELLPGLAPSAARRARRALQRAGVTLQLGTAYCDTIARSSDLLLWATGAQAHGWLPGSGLAVNREGFVRVDAQLRSLSHPEVLAAGDCADWTPDPLPKAGVFAVRMGPALSRNLRALLGSGEAPAPYRPQRRFLALLSTGDRRAIAAWGRWSAEGAWAWRLKERIDRRFVEGFALRAAPDAAHHPPGTR